MPKKKRVLEHPILDPSLLCFSGDFDNQIDSLLRDIRLTREEVENIDSLLRDLSINFHRLWPGCKINPFGSIITGLGIKTSDIDCFVELPPWERRHPSKIVFMACDSLRTQSALFKKLQPISRAKVPIVKFLHRPTYMHCDVSFSSQHGVRNSMLLAYLLHHDPRALPIAVIIKFWAKLHKLTGTNFMPNYALILLVVFYLQQMKVLPSVYELQANLEPHEKYIVDHWETGFNKTAELVPENAKNKSLLYELLGGFFEYYSSFDFTTNLVSVFLGCSVKKELFRSINTVPAPFRLYDANLHDGLILPLRIDTSMCVQDPFDHSRNCAVAVNKALFPKIIEHFRHAAKCFKEEQSSDFLKAILTTSPQPANIPREIRVPTNSGPSTTKPPMNSMRPVSVHGARMPKRIGTQKPGQLTNKFIEMRQIKRKRR